MPRLTIDNQEVEVPPGSTVLDAARRLGIAIPTLCHFPGLEPATSCMVCVVKVGSGHRLSPSCALKAEEGMKIQSQCPEVLEARRTALDLLLAEHIGDCMGPCHMVCPAQMDIPLMIRQIRAGQLDDAIRTVKQRIALPAVLGRVCHAPCEKGCRRSQADAPVSICLLKRYVADADLARPQPWLPPIVPPSFVVPPSGGPSASLVVPPQGGSSAEAVQAATEKNALTGTLRAPAVAGTVRAGSGKKVAIVGAGPAGLSAAWYLLQQGHACTIFDEQETPGGMLHRIEPDRLEPSVLAAEAGLVIRLGAQFRGLCRVGRDVSLEQLRSEYDAVILAVGEASPSAGDVGRELGELAARGEQKLEEVGRGPGVIQADRRTFRTALPGVFAGGSATRTGKHAVFAVADGRGLAESVGQFLAQAEVTGPERPFNVSLGKLLDGEIDKFMAAANPVARAQVAPGQPLSDAQAHDESVRCLHCDCRKASTCMLREFSRQYDAKAARYRNRRVQFQQRIDHPRLVYEGGKCISCGICIHLVERAGRRPGLSFIGRGFGVQVSVPFGGTLEEAVGDLADQLVACCPTAAWAFKD